MPIIPLNNPLSRDVYVLAPADGLLGGGGANISLQWNLHMVDSLGQTSSVRCLEVSAVQRFPTVSLILTHFVCFVV